jgi:hypothetical protein
VKLRSVFRHERRWHADFVVGLVLLCQAGAWVHAAATPHITCLEHGESLHLAAGDADPHGDGLSIAPVLAEPSAHAHEHCSLQGQRSTSASFPARTFVAVHLVPVPEPVVALGDRAVQLLRLAPKTSPPRTPVA